MNGSLVLLDLFLLLLKLDNASADSFQIALEVREDPLALCMLLGVDDAYDFFYLIKRPSSFSVFSRQVDDWHGEPVHGWKDSGQGLSDLAHALEPVIVRVKDIAFGHYKVQLVLTLLLQIKVLDYSHRSLAQRLPLRIQEDKDKIALFCKPLKGVFYVKLVSEVSICKTWRVNEYDVLKVAGSRG